MTDSKPFGINQDQKQIENQRTIHQSDFIPKIVKQVAVDGMIIKRGLAADRPDGSTDTKAYFATDTNVLSIWNGTAWKSTTLS